MITGTQIMLLLKINYKQLCYLVDDDLLIPVLKKNSPRSNEYNEKDVEILCKNKKRFKNNLLALEIENEWR